MGGDWGANDCPETWREEKGSETTTQRSVGQQKEGQQETEHFLKREKAEKNRDSNAKQTLFSFHVIHEIILKVVCRNVSTSSQKNTGG